MLATAMAPAAEHIMNARRFCVRVEELSRNMGVIEATVHLAEVAGIEPEFAADLLSADLKERIRVEAQNLHLLNRMATLPL